MALKRINKELTDLGRYVLPLSSPRFARMTARSAGRRRNLCASAAVLPCCLENFELTIAIVTLPRPALPAPSEMIWYVTPTGPTAEAAKLLALSLPLQRGTANRPSSQPTR